MQVSDMREILFRGFHKNPNGPDTVIIDGKPVRGKWVYGFFWKDIWGDGESCYILYDGEDYPVIPATVDWSYCCPHCGARMDFEGT